MPARRALIFVIVFKTMAGKRCVCRNSRQNPTGAKLSSAAQSACRRSVDVSASLRGAEAIPSLQDCFVAGGSSQ
jgi:hypothetical protein